MTKPTYTLPITGTAPDEVATKGDHEQAVQDVADALYDKIQAHEDQSDNPHSVTKAQVGLGNVDNTSDVDKPVSTAQQEAIDAEQTARQEAFTGIGFGDQVPTALDWNAIAKSGIYRGSGSLGETVGVPENLVHLLVQHSQGSLGRAYQMARNVLTTDPRLWLRSRDRDVGAGGTGEWGDWVEMASQAWVDENAVTLDLIQSANWDEITETGFYRGDGSDPNGTVGSPLNLVHMQVRHYQGALQRATQIATRATRDNPEMFIRNRDMNGVWGDWVKLLTENSDVTGGGGTLDPATAPFVSRGLPENSLWRFDNLVRTQRAYGDIYNNVIDAGLDLTYDFYDDLVIAYPDYVSRSEIGQDALENPIYCYDFKPGDYSGATDEPEWQRLPKFVWIGGTHGNERRARSTQIAFFQELCADWRRDEFLSLMRWGVHWRVIPASCPTGVEESSRRNHNDVDPNRNYPTGWDESSDPNKGPSAGSEAEVQAISAFIAANDDLSVLVDHHNQNTLGASGYAHWVGAVRGEDIGAVLPAVASASAFLRRDFPIVEDSGEFNDNSPLARVSGAIEGGLIRHASTLTDGACFLIEQPFSFGAAVPGSTTLDHLRFAQYWVRQFWQASYEMTMRRRSTGWERPS